MIRITNSESLLFNQLLFLSHRGHLNREGRAGARGRREFLTSVLPARHLGQRKEQMLAGARRALTCSGPI